MVGFGMFVSRMQWFELGLFAAPYLAWTSGGGRNGDRPVQGGGVSAADSPSASKAEGASPAT
jgi:hypothetical protein